ncbi:MAG: PrgI family protein [Firmicutes bacterium]|nr:PrgI family protein [Bacillota bacterium]
MSIEVRVPEEIKDYKESIVAGLSIRQLVCGAFALGCGVPTFLLLRNINNDIATYTTMAIVTPAFCVGFIKKGGYTFEKFIAIKIKAMFGKNKRTYETKGNLPPIEMEEYRDYYTELQNEEKESDRPNGKEKRVSGKVRRTTQREFDLVEISTQSPQRKRKAAYKAIATAERVGRKEKQEEKEETKGGGST